MKSFKISRGRMLAEVLLVNASLLIFIIYKRPPVEDGFVLFLVINFLFFCYQMINKNRSVVKITFRETDMIIEKFGLFNERPYTFSLGNLSATYERETIGRGITKEYVLRIFHESKCICIFQPVLTGWNREDISDIKNILSEKGVLLLSN